MRQTHCGAALRFLALFQYKLFSAVPTSATNYTPKDLRLLTILQVPWIIVDLDIVLEAQEYILYTRLWFGDFKARSGNVIH